MIDPAGIRDYAGSKLARNRTDKLDADMIADLCQTQNPPPWTALAPEVRELRDMVRHLEDLRNIRTQESNRLASGVTPEQIRPRLQSHLAFLDQQIKELEKRIQDYLDLHPDLKKQRDLLVRIPGIGAPTAANSLSENIQSFSSTRSLVVHAGLNPQSHESGSSLRGRPGRAADPLRMTPRPARRWQGTHHQVTKTPRDKPCSLGVLVVDQGRCLVQLPGASAWKNEMALSLPKSLLTGIAIGARLVRSVVKRFPKTSAFWRTWAAA